MLQEYKDELKRLTMIAHQLFDIDVAVFDPQSRLVACTDAYLKQKGSTVHAPSIEEVMVHGKVVVNKPGHMASCKGCRFIGQCPATIEILRSIEVDDAAVGAVAFTSFSKLGHDRIARETETYVDTLKVFSEWMADTIWNKERRRQLLATTSMLQSALELSGASLFCVDRLGRVVQCSQSAMQLLSVCDLSAGSLHHLLPEPLVEKILAGIPLSDVRIRIGNESGQVSSIPVVVGGDINGAVVAVRTRELGQAKRYEPRLPAEQLTFSSIIGRSRLISDVCHQAQKVSRSFSTILITGDTGTGKGLLARAIHNNSDRAAGPFVTVNCTSIPESLFESELFGYEEGAFTGARRGGKPGRFELAEGGTLFLDEIGELPLSMQVKLLNVLQDFAFQRVGGISMLPIDVRVIAATNQDIEQLIEQKAFRRDLFYRLNVIPLHIPPLIDRLEDIEPLAQHFLKRVAARLNKPASELSTELLHELLQHPWPGNVRELENVMEYCVNMEDSPQLTKASLPPGFTHTNRDGAVVIRGAARSAENAILIAALARHGMSLSGKKAAAAELGIGLRTLYRKLRQAESELGRLPGSDHQAPHRKSIKEQ